MCVIQISTCIYVNMYVCIHVYMFICLYVYVYVHVYMYVYIDCTDTHIYIYTYARRHIYRLTINTFTSGWIEERPKQTGMHPVLHTRNPECYEPEPGKQNPNITPMPQFPLRIPKRLEPLSRTAQTLPLCLLSSRVCRYYTREHDLQLQEYKAPQGFAKSHRLRS